MTTTEVTLDAAATEAFLQGLRGRVLQPGDEGYDDARKLWNGLIDRRQRIVRCSGAADVVDCVNFAREHNCCSPSAEARNVAGNAVNDGGLVIDLADERRPRRPGHRDGAGPGRSNLGRHGP